jgi:hypothetical protein
MHFELPFKCKFCDLICDSIPMEFEFQSILEINFVYWIVELLFSESRIRTNVFIDPKLELQPLDYQISVFLDMELELVFPYSQMHSPPHINVAKLFNWVSYDCLHSANICKWWLATIVTLNPINSPKWFHLKQNLTTFVILCLNCVATLATIWTLIKKHWFAPF